MAGDGTGGVVWTPQCAELMGKTAAQSSNFAPQTQEAGGKEGA